MTTENNPRGTFGDIFMFDIILGIELVRELKFENLSQFQLGGPNDFPIDNNISAYTPVMLPQSPLLSIRSYLWANQYSSKV